VSALPRALFVCIGNAGRSQMAQAFYERRGGEARSAGSRPESELHPGVVEAMGEVGISLEGRTPRGIAGEDVEWAEVVVTMGCGEACPVLPGKRYIDWEIRDPVRLPAAEVRPIRDEIERLVADLPRI
jgi:protein-tyrosine-phosphatase